MYRVSNIYDRVCIDIHDTRYTIHDVFMYRVPNSAVDEMVPEAGGNDFLTFVLQKVRTISERNINFRKIKNLDKNFENFNIQILRYAQNMF